MSAIEFGAEFMGEVKRRARQVFAKHPNRQELIDDTLSVAWELLQTASEAATPKTLAYYATRRVLSRRQFQERQRSVTGPNPRGLPKPERESGSLVDALDPLHDPAELAQVKLDFTAWLDALTDREQELLVAFMRGERTKDLARRYGVTCARISQIRNELVEHWLAFTS